MRGRNFISFDCDVFELERFLDCTFGPTCDLRRKSKTAESSVYSFTLCGRSRASDYHGLMAVVQNRVVDMLLRKLTRGNIVSKLNIK